MVVALDQEEPGVAQDVIQFTARILTRDKFPYRANQTQTINTGAENARQEVAHVQVEVCDSLSMPFRTARTEDDSFSLFLSDPFERNVQNWFRAVLLP